MSSYKLNTNDEENEDEDVINDDKVKSLEYTTWKIRDTGEQETHPGLHSSHSGTNPNSPNFKCSGWKRTRSRKIAFNKICLRSYELGCGYFAYKSYQLR